MGNIVYNTTYDALLDLLADYYGGYSSNGMQQIIDAGVTDDAIVESINAIPNYHVVRNYDGTVRMTINTYGSGSTSSASNLASQINSNAQAGTNTATKTIAANTPAQTGYSQNGTLTISKNINATTTKQFITKSVVPAIAAAGVGISLGKTIDRALYNANPNFWDSIGMQGLDPSTWSGITSDMDGSFGEKALGTVFNLLFGIDPQTKKAQTYIDETAYAYLALFMQKQGVFGQNTWDGEQPDGWNIAQPVTVRTPSSLTVQNSGTPPTYYCTQYNGAFDPVTYFYYGLRFNDDNVPDNLLLTYFNVITPANKIGVLFTATTSFRSGVQICDNDGYNIGGSALSNARSFTYDNKTVYYDVFSIDNTYSIYGSYSPDNTSSNLDQLAWITQYGHFTTSGVTGIDDQQGATLPYLDDNMSVADALNALKTQYPELWNNKETMDVAQPDGSVKTYTYIPIPYPTSKGQDDTQPTGNGQYQNQGNTAYDPLTATDVDYNDFIRLIDPDTPDYDYDDDGGEGDTPPVVTPTGSASALWKIYNPSQAQLDAFGSWLWSSDFVDQILKLFNDPMQAIIGLHKVFVTPPTSGSGAIKVGYLTSTASANYVSAQYTDVDCGSVTLDEYFGNVFDYSPYTKIRLFLPFIGIVPLEISDVMRGSIKVLYHVDVLTGTCLAEVKITRDMAGGTLYTFSGNCAVQYPVSSGSYVGIVTGLLGMAGGIAGTIASGGALAPMLMGAGASIGAMHADVEHSGKISSNAGAMGGKKPYLIIERPQTKMPTNGEIIEGLPQNKTVTLGSLSGRVKVKKCHYDGIPCTSNELDKIKALLESGVYIN